MPLCCCSQSLAPLFHPLWGFEGLTWQLWLYIHTQGLGAKTLPGVYEPAEGESFCRYAEAIGTGLPGGNPLALKSKVVPGGAGAHDLRHGVTPLHE